MINHRFLEAFHEHLRLKRHLATLIHSQTAKHLFEEWASIRRRLDYLKGWSLGAPVTRQSLLRYHRLAGIQRIIFQDWAAVVPILLPIVRLQLIRSQLAEVLDGLEGEKLDYDEFVMLGTGFKG